MRKVLVAGATGYLGGFLVKELKTRGYWVRVLIREESQKQLFDNIDDCFLGQVTKPETLNGVTKDIDIVYSTIGITRQRDGLTYMDVDYQGNLNLLHEAQKDKVQSFLYVSALNGDKLRNLKIFQAKEAFVDKLKASGLNYVVFRPNGFFSDMVDFLEMAKKGKVYLFGDGEYKLNPIHGKDLAKVCVDALDHSNQEVEVGGPDILTQNEIGKLALEAYAKKPNIVHLPDWLRKFIIWIVRTFSPATVYGPYEFFLTAMAIDNVAPTYGEHRLKQFFKQEANRHE